MGYNYFFLLKLYYSADADSITKSLKNTTLLLDERVSSQAIKDGKPWVFSDRNKILSDASKSVEKLS